MHKKRRVFFAARCLCHVESFRASRVETPGDQIIGVLSALYMKQANNVMKYQLYMNASKIIDEYSF